MNMSLQSPSASQPTANQPILEVKDLFVSFATESGIVPAVRGISFDLNAGETLALVGESGSGKSVTSLSIMRLTPPGSKVNFGGRVQLLGADGRQRNLLDLPQEEMRRIRGNEIAMIFQEPMTSLNPVLTVGRQISEALLAHRNISRSSAEAETLRLLDKVRIPDARSRVEQYPHNFSGGMRQRVMIAMALACNPKVLIADEPTTALDVTIQAQILELIKSLQSDEGMAVLFVTHDMGIVAEIADRTVVMYNGEAVETGDTARIFAQPKHPYTRALLSAVPTLGSMHGRERPMRFPVVDRVTGQTAASEEVPDTVKETVSPLLEVKGLTKTFNLRAGLLAPSKGRVHAVQNVSFHLNAGETLALVGESGCGKSTTGRVLMRLATPDCGSVLVDGVDILKLGKSDLKKQRRHMQMIFQDPFASLNPRMTIGDAIANPLVINKLAGPSEARDKVSDLLKRVGLEPVMARRYPHEFSGGQRQRICIARVLALQPKLIIGDEAVSALDVSVKAQVINLMLDLQAELGLAYLFISHDMAAVERISHRVAVMYLGEIVEIGPRSAIFQNPQHPYTKRLLTAVPIADPTRRQQKRIARADEIKSPIRPPDFVPPARTYREISPGHSVMNFEDWI